MLEWPASLLFNKYCILNCLQGNKKSEEFSTGMVSLLIIASPLLLVVGHPIFITPVPVFAE
jgi:hypothetical protein